MIKFRCGGCTAGKLNVIPSGRGNEFYGEIAREWDNLSFQLWNRSCFVCYPPPPEAFCIFTWKLPFIIFLGECKKVGKVNIFNKQICFSFPTSFIPNKSKKTKKQKEFNIVMSGQFHTLAMFEIEVSGAEKNGLDFVTIEQRRINRPKRKPVPGRGCSLCRQYSSIAFWISSGNKEQPRNGMCQSGSRREEMDIGFLSTQDITSLLSPIWPLVLYRGMYLWIFVKLQNVFVSNGKIQDIASPLSPIWPLVLYWRMHLCTLYFCQTANRGGR